MRSSRGNHIAAGYTLMFLANAPMHAATAGYAGLLADTATINATAVHQLLAELDFAGDLNR